MNVIKYLFSYIRMLTKQQQRHYNKTVNNECTKIQILNENSTFNRVDRKERKIMKNEALMTGVKLMASNASDLACELEKEVPSTNTEDKN